MIFKIYNRDLLKAEAEKRTGLHVNHSSQRQWSDNYDYVGLCGEADFGNAIGYPHRTHDGPQGDNGVDFTVRFRRDDGQERDYTIDIKTHRNPFNLIHAQGRVVADIYIQAQFLGELGVDFLGWHWGSVLKASPVRDFGNFGVPAHYIPISELRDMRELLSRVVIPQ